MKKLATLIAVAALSLLLLPTTGIAAVNFFLSDGTNPNGDLAWQAAVGSFTEFDLNGFSNGQIVQNLFAGSTTITIGPGATGQEIFFGSYGGGGGVFGTVSGGAFLNRDANGTTTANLISPSPRQFQDLGCGYSITVLVPSTAFR